MITFFVPGVPATKGSVRSFVRGGKTIIKHDCSRLLSWTAEIALAAHAAGVTPTYGPVEIEATWSFSRPKSHCRGGKPGSDLKLSAPRFMRKKPDIDKLARALLDALTGVAYADDAQVVRLILGKRYAAMGEVAGCQVKIRW